MNKTAIEQLINDFLEKSDLNIISEDKALAPDMVGLKIWDGALVGFASADNAYLNTLRDIPEANIKIDSPKYWLPEAKSVISFFLSYSERIRKSNVGGSWPSTEWLHGRIEGQYLIKCLLENLRDEIIAEGHKAVIPLLDERFYTRMGEDLKENEFGSNWSERHVAYACGLGTFALSKGFITEKGIAGRFGSLVTDAEFEPTLSDTSKLFTQDELYGNCIMCGACVRRCPMDAISLDAGKLHKPCSDFIDRVLSDNPPYYGCGKCQVGVPCENRNPSR